MSLGFLTESALVPSKATPIKVDAQSLVDLKAVVFQKDQERQQRLRDALEADDAGGSGRNLAKYAHLRGKSRKRGGSASLSREEDCLGKCGTNRGVEKRSRRDEEAAELEIGDRDDDEATARKSKAMLEKKARLYEQMMSGSGQSGAASAVASEFLVDFELKRLTSSGDKRAAAPESEEDPVEIVDEFGRTRLVPRGSPEHQEFVKASLRKDQQQQKDHSYSSDHVTRDEVESTAERGGGGSFVVSQWEHRLNATEKSYLHQVHERAVLAKAAAPGAGTAKMSKKQLRLEKLRQERAKAAAAKGTPSTGSSETSLKPQDTQGAAPASDAAVSAQATDFLNQLSSFM